MRTVAEFEILADRFLAAEVGTLTVDEIAVPYGRDALDKALSAARRAAHFHLKGLDEFDRNQRLRKALADGIDAAHRVMKDGGLTPATGPAMHFAAVARKQLELMPSLARNGRGSPGRPVMQAAAEAVASVYRRETGRPIPRSGKVAEGHPLAALLRAASVDLFGSAGALSVSLLRTPKK